MARRPPSDRRSAAAAEYRKLYKGARWQRLRLSVLQSEPLCRFCKAEGRTTAATVVDHIEPHRGDEALFWARNNLQPLCDADPWLCHSRVKQREESTGYSGAVGVDGFPTDPRHPANAPRRP